MPPTATPSLQRQKTFIIENSGNLSREIKMAILNIIMIEVGTDVAKDATSTKAIIIDLDAVGAANEEVITNIYNLVRGHRERLNQPSNCGQSEIKS